MSLVLLAFGMITTTQAALTDEFLTSKDGIELSVRFEKTANPEGLQVKCKVTNRNQFDVQYINIGQPIGLYFKLVDSAAREITPQDRWSFIALQALLRPGSRRPRIIKPSESVEFKLVLNEAYGDRLKNGATLFIEWIPDEGGVGNTLKIGKGLKASFDLTGELPRQTQPSVSSESKAAETSEREAHRQKPPTTKKAP